MYYLTLNGDEPQDADLDKTKVKCISYKHEILPWIDKCINSVKEVSPLREILLQYYRLLKKLTYQNEQDELTMDMVNLLMKGNNLELAEKVVRSIDETKAKIEFKFWSMLKDALKDGMKSLGFFLVEKDNEDNVHTCDEKTIRERHDKKKYREEGVGLDFLVYKFRDGINLTLGIIENRDSDCRVYWFFYFSRNRNWVDERSKEIPESLRNLLKTINRILDAEDFRAHYPKSIPDISFFDKSIYNVSNEESMRRVVNALQAEIISIANKVNESDEIRRSIQDLKPLSFTKRH